MLRSVIILLTYLYLFLTLIFFSSIEVSSMFIKNSIHPYTLTVIRFLIGGLTLLPVALMTQKKKAVRLKKRDLLDFVGLGLLACGVSMGALQMSVFLGKPSTTAILVSANPVFVTLFSILLFKEQFTVQKGFTLILGVIGICLISFSPGQGDTVVGMGLGIFSSVTFAIYTIFNKKKCEQFPSIITVAYSFLFGSLISLPFVFLIPGGWNLTLDLGGWLILIYLGTIVTGWAYYFYFKALEVLSASVGSLVFFAKPVVASLMAYFLLNDLVSVRKIIGIALILLALSLPNLQKKLGKNHQLSSVD